jgi:hypothetical protein
MMRQALLVKLLWSLVSGPCAASEGGVDVPAGDDAFRPIETGAFLSRKTRFARLSAWWLRRCFTICTSLRA